MIRLGYTTISLIIILYFITIHHYLHYYDHPFIAVAVYSFIIPSEFITIGNYYYNCNKPINHHHHHHQRQQQQQQQFPQLHKKYLYCSTDSSLISNSKKRQRLLSLRVTTNNHPNNDDNNDTDDLLVLSNYFHWEYGSMSVAGTDPDRPTKINQDGTFFSSPSKTALQQQQQSTTTNTTTSNIITTIWGVMDGHGKKGHEVVQYIQEQLPSRIHEYITTTTTALKSSAQNNQLTVNDEISQINGFQKGALSLNTNNESFSLDEQKLALISMGNADYSELFDFDYDDPEMSVSMAAVESAILNAYLHTQYDVRCNPNVPSSRSGTTCITCVLLIHEPKIDNEEDVTKNPIVTLYTANVGDSRAILITTTSNNNMTWTVQALTNATTVNIPTERNRIECCYPNSRIDTSGNVFYGPIGIAMTRSLGNSVMLRAGILPIPIITKQQLSLQQTASNGTVIDEDDISYYICVGTDGIFDVLSNVRVMNLIQDGIIAHHSLNDIATHICHIAKLAWLADLPIETKVDDCTISIFKLSNRPMAENAM